MSSFPSAVLLVVLVAGVLAVSTTPEVDFFTECPPSRCSAGGPEVRYPLRLNTSSPFCGAPGLVLHCSGDYTILGLLSSGKHKVTGIDYTNGAIMLDARNSRGRCWSGRVPLINVAKSGFKIDICHMYTVVNCSVEVTKVDEDNRSEFFPIRCLGGAGHFVYAVKTFMPMDMLPPACDVVSTGAIHPKLLPLTASEFCDERAKVNLQLHWGGCRPSGVETRVLGAVAWKDSWVPFGCRRCEAGGGRCAFNRRGNETFCYSPPAVRDKPVSLITVSGATSAALVAMITATLVLLYITRKARSAKETRLKVEKFLAAYGTTRPTRYSYSDLKKITKRFRHKLGQGGFASVYKGELPNGVPVAVKMLQKSMGVGEDFINEVATTGRIHHVNVIRLLGFCSEGPRRALVYEFMPNESLEKYIFSKDGKRRQPLSLERLEEIAVGIARGIEYLHQGCSERILHFDIKPHNILLDDNFHPKISDFGLAKLCSKDQSIVSMTAARGTMGYIAPEVYSRNFGTVSYKSDVYSFGMLLMEMISGRKTVEPTLQTNSQVYLPEQIYDRLVRGEELASGMEMEGKEEIARKLAIVALWCIQWNPNDRPSMTRVVQMLTGSLQSLEIPITPFVSFADECSLPPPPVNL